MKITKVTNRPSPTSHDKYVEVYKKLNPRAARIGDELDISAVTILFLRRS
ncbi:MAG: hypothetical protein FWG87_08285 [Defluviitaleaceae bacterium]|nr:hypothetical protein [Defluviitaleaceae bacterium]